MLLDSIKAVSCSEYKRDTPYTRKGNYGIDNPADRTHRSATDPSHDIKVEDSYTSPVKSADNGKNKSYSIYYHHHYDLFFSAKRV